jgi:hypothetical protein
MEEAGVRFTKLTTVETPVAEVAPVATRVVKRKVVKVLTGKSK